MAIISLYAALIIALAGVVTGEIGLVVFMSCGLTLAVTLAIALSRRHRQR
jgi:hypothetical protein